MSIKESRRAGISIYCETADSERSHTQKTRRSAKLKSERYFFIRAAVLSCRSCGGCDPPYRSARERSEPYPKRTPACKSKTATTNPSQPPLIIMGGVKTRLPAFECALKFCLCLETNTGHGVASLTERRQAGFCICCESARKRSEPYPKDAQKRKAEIREIVFYMGNCLIILSAGEP